MDIQIPEAPDAGDGLVAVYFVKSSRGVDSSFAQERAVMPLRIRFNGANNETKL